MIHYLHLLFATFTLILPAFGGTPLTREEKEWLRQVNPLITLQERKIFRKRLNTPQERKAFVELFWAKRDEDLSDNENPFRREYLARYDYVITHFKAERGLFQEFTRRDIFLLLGKPSELSNRIDFGLMGPGYRNAFHQHEPELWIFDNPGFGYRRDKLKIQFVPTTSFGDFVGVTDRLSSHWLQQLKFKLIINPDLEHAPVQATSDDYQVVELSGEDLDDDFADDDADDDEDEEAPAAASATASLGPDRAQPVQTGSAGTAPDPAESGSIDEVAGAAAENAPSPAAQPAPDSQTLRPAGGEAVTGGELAVPALPADRPVRGDILETELNVPSKTTVLAEEQANFHFDTAAANPLTLRGRTAHFKSGTDRVLVLGRIGFPLDKLRFTTTPEGYLAPFTLHYQMTDSSGKTVLADSIRQEMKVPDKRAIERGNVYYSEAFAVLLAGDRYDLRVQVSEGDGTRTSFFEKMVEVPPTDNMTITTSDLVLMDPNVNPERAKFKVQGTPFHLRLTDRFRIGERLYPVVEIVNLPEDEEIGNIRIQAFKDGALVHAWNLYEEEITNTNQNSLLLHPTLNTNALGVGAYLLRFEMELTNGDLMLAEAPFEIGAP